MIKKIAKILAWILIVLLIAGLIGIVLRFTNNGTEDFKTFYIERNGKEIFSSKSKMNFVRGNTERFDVVYTFDVGKSEPREYNVTIIANNDVNYTFAAGDGRYSWRNLGDVSSLFSLEKHDTYFTFGLPSGDFRSDLEALFPGKAISYETEPRDSYLYTLIVSSYNESVVYEINFMIAGESIKFDPDHLIF